jgi:signal transduction histidine kinase
VVAQDEERRRLERNIHDGCQQQLVTLALAMRMAERRFAGDGRREVTDLLQQASEELSLTLQELRELAQGIHPAILTEQGLGPALSSLAERATVPVSVSASGTEGLDPSIEATAYYAVSEALQNVAKYAKASRVRVLAERRDGSLLVEVEDDGQGGADPSRGSGLRGLADRVAAVAGTLRVDSPPGRGTRLSLVLPCR